MKAGYRVLSIGLAALLVIGCNRSSSKKKVEKPPEPPAVPFGQRPPLKETLPVKPATEPERITVQHILISFKGKMPKVQETKEEAEKIARDLLARARGGEDFERLVGQWSQDQYPGIYTITNKGVTPNIAQREFAREKLDPGYGLGFELSPGNIDLAVYDPDKSPVGFHVIKRLK